MQQGEKPLQRGMRKWSGDKAQLLFLPQAWLSSWCYKMGMRSGYHCPSQMQDVLKLLLSGAIPCTKLIQMFWDAEWGLKCPGFDILALLHTCCMAVGKHRVSSLPHFLGCEINNNSTLMCTHPQKCKSWHTIKAQQLLTITCPCQHHHCYCLLLSDGRL